MTYSLMTLSRGTLGKLECHRIAECFLSWRIIYCYLNAILLNVIPLNVIVLNVFLLKVNLLYFF